MNEIKARFTTETTSDGKYRAVLTVDLGHADLKMKSPHTHDQAADTLQDRMKMTAMLKSAARAAGWRLKSGS